MSPWGWRRGPSALSRWPLLWIGAVSRCRAFQGPWRKRDKLPRCCPAYAKSPAVPVVAGFAGNPKRANGLVHWVPTASRGSPERPSIVAVCLARCEARPRQSRESRGDVRVGVQSGRV